MQLSAKVLKYKETLQKEMQRKQVVGIQDRRIDVHFRNLSVWGQGGIEDVLYGQSLHALSVKRCSLFRSKAEL